MTLSSLLNLGSSLTPRLSLCLGRMEQARRRSSECWPDDSNLMMAVSLLAFERTMLGFQNAMMYTVVGEAVTCRHMQTCTVKAMYIPLAAKAPMLNVSYKPQKISPKSSGTVRQLLHEKIRDAYIHPQFVTDVIKPLQIEQLFDQEVSARFDHKCPQRCAFLWGEPV